MVLKKQTIWLLTMLTLMVVLSAYYLINGDPKEIGVQGETNHTEITTYDGLIGKDNEHSEYDGTLSSNDMGLEMNTVLSTATEDSFALMRMEREQTRAELWEKYITIVQSNKDNNAVAEATAKIDQLESLENDEATAESLIKSKGYSDAVVQSDKGKVKVTIMAAELKNQEVVSIIDLVAKHMNVPGINVTVKNTP